MNSIPTPHKKNLKSFLLYMRDISIDKWNEEYIIILEWITFLSKYSPYLLRWLLYGTAKSYKPDTWCEDIVEAVAKSGCVSMLVERLAAFSQNATLSTQETKLLQWMTMPSFAIPRIAKKIITISVHVLNSMNRRRRKTFICALMNSYVLTTTIYDIAPWFSKRLPETNLVSICRKNKYPTISCALRNTNLWRTVLIKDKFSAAVRLAHFFRYTVSSKKIQNVIRDDCPVCLTTRVLQSLHGDKRHAVCLSCVKKLIKHGSTSCPICRIECTY